MKQHIFTFILLTIFSTIPCYGMEAAFVTQVTVIGDRVERAPLNIASDAQPYITGLGGVTFAYPANWFTQPPIVQISLQQDSVHPTTQTFVAEVSANSTTSTTVMVYQVNAGLVNEAPTGVITVCLLAINNPA